MTYPKSLKSQTPPLQGLPKSLDLMVSLSLSLIFLKNLEGLSPLAKRFILILLILSKPSMRKLLALSNLLIVSEGLPL